MSPLRQNKHFTSQIVYFIDKHQGKAMSVADELRSILMQNSDSLVDYANLSGFWVA
jgi:hypothetical protein